MAETERVVHTRSTSPATTVEQNPTAHEKLTHLESARFQAFTGEVDLLREGFSHSLEGQEKNLKWTRSKLTNVTSRVRDLQDFVAQVETFVHEHCSSPGYSELQRDKCVLENAPTRWVYSCLIDC